MAIQNKRTRLDQNLMMDEEDEQALLFLVVVDQAEEDEETFKETTRATVRALVDDQRDNEARTMLATYGNIDAEDDPDEPKKPLPPIPEAVLADKAGKEDEPTAAVSTPRASNGKAKANDDSQWDCPFVHSETFNV